MGKPGKTNLNILGTCDKKVLCVTQSLGGAAHSKVNETVEKSCQNKIGSSKVKTCKKKSHRRLKGHNLGA